VLLGRRLYWKFVPQAEFRAVKKKAFDSRSLVREIARERVGSVPPSKVIVPKPARRKPKHKKPILPENADE